MKGRLLLAFLVVAGACGSKADVIDWQRMKEQAKAVPYRDTPFFPDGRVLQKPPAGTIRHDRAELPPAIDEGMVGTAYVTRIPVPVTAELVARGRDRWNVFCAACHGLAGDGDSEVATQMALRRPPSLLASTVREFPPGRIFRVATEGFGFMPSYRLQIGVADRWAIVAYVKALQIAQGSKLADLPAGLRREAEAAVRGAQ